MTRSESSKPRSRAEQKERTRALLIDTTMDLIAEGGLEWATLARVAERAGLSRGICNYHFSTKERLLLETLQTVHLELDALWRSILENEAEPAAGRLARFVRRAFDPELTAPRKLAVWLSYWGETRSRRTYLEACAARDREYEEALERVIVELAGGDGPVAGLAPRAVAVALTGMIDGFWLQFLIAPGRLTRDEAVRACMVYLAGLFPAFETGGERS